MQTTQQLGSSCRFFSFFILFLFFQSTERKFFRIKFTLKVFVGGHSELVHTCHCVSNSIEVFSHTLYLSGKSGIKMVSFWVVGLGVWGLLLTLVCVILEKGFLVSLKFVFSHFYYHRAS